jgi:propane 2-monooxygenase small subunit
MTGRRGDSMRSFDTFTPQKRRATQYEDVTIDSQPSTERFLDRGWPVSFADGRGTWDAGSTQLRSEDWYAYRDPEQRWERTFFQVGAGYERQIEGAVTSAATDHLFADFTPEWVGFLRANLQVPAFVEHGLWLAAASLARDCLSDSLTHAVVLHAAHKQRLAQSIVLYAMDLEPHFGPFPIEPARQRFLSHEAWQPVRRYVERLRSTRDWGEVIVAANVCFEPIVGVAIRREFGIRAATVNGDTVTPVVARVGQQEWDWISGWTAAFTRLVLEDERHGAANREVVGAWLADWMPAAHQAAQALAALVDELPIGFAFEPAMAGVLRDAEEYFELAGVGGLVGPVVPA